MNQTTKETRRRSYDAVLPKRAARCRVIHQKSHTITCACDICVFYDNVIRHFTVEELEKLQGLPTSYTAAVPEPARKRAIGNGWTASVIAEIFKLLPQAETAAKTDVA